MAEPSTAPELLPDHPAGECYRCGYDLRGIADDHPCPECGLLAERSRRLTDELHDTRPRWLGSISMGVWLILLAILLSVSIPLILLAAEPWILTRLGRGIWAWLELSIIAGLHAVALLFAVGVFLLTRPEGYAPADRADRLRRILLRALALFPLLAILLALLELAVSLLGYAAVNWRALLALGQSLALALAIGTIPLPLLLFYQLRSLARRARSADLAEHCAIVGIGASGALLFLTATAFLAAHMDQGWLARSAVGLILMLLVGVLGGLFLLWALYLLVRFAIAFHRAARQLRHKWRRDDLAGT